MVLTQKPFSVHSAICAPQTNTEDVGDNKLCLDALKTSGQWRYLKAAAFVLNSADTMNNGTALANGLNNANVAINAGQTNNGGTWPAAPAANSGFMSGYQRWVCAMTNTTPVTAAITGLPSNKLFVQVDSNSFNTFKITPVMSAVSAEGTYSVLSWVIDLYMAAATPPASTSFDADVYINVPFVDDQ